jgi:hypothetical protein
MRDAVVGASETRMDIGKDLAWSAENEEYRVRRRGLAGFLARVLERRFCDRLGQVSRPILLLSVILLDFVIVAASGLGALLATGEMPPVGVVDVMAIALVAVFVVTALSTNWSYSIGALRQPAAQMGKILTAVAIVTISLSGILHLAGVIVVKPAAAVAWAGLTVIALALTRLVEARTIEHLARAHRLRRRAVIVGGGEDAAELLELLKDEQSHLDILGLFDDRQRMRDSDGAHPDLARLGTFEELAAFCRGGRTPYRQRAGGGGEAAARDRQPADGASGRPPDIGAQCEAAPQPGGVFIYRPGADAADPRPAAQ